MKKRVMLVVAALLAAAGATGWWFGESQRLRRTCSELVVRQLVAPSSATFVSYEVRPERSMRLARASGTFGGAKAGLVAATGARDTAKAIAVAEVELKKMKALVKEMEEDPRSEVVMELDAQNRAGAMLRMVAVCAFVDGEGVDNALSSMELALLEER